MAEEKKKKKKREQAFHGRHSCGLGAKRGNRKSFIKPIEPSKKKE